MVSCSTRWMAEAMPEAVYVLANPPWQADAAEGGSMRCNISPALIQGRPRPDPVV
jgi:hypothetical protein